MKVLVAGGGIGGLVAALALHAKGFDVTVFEQAREMRALGVGINLLPHAVGVLHNLGLADALAAVAIDAQEYVYMNRHGQTILADARGLRAGYAYPQYSIHRGDLQMLLFAAAQRALGADRIRCGMRLSAFEETKGTVRALFSGPDGGPAGDAHGDVLVAADGIHSAARARFYPDEGMPKWNGVTIWRGVSVGKPFLTGGSVVKAGTTDQKFICYAISRRHAERGGALINWIADLHTPERPYLTREDWNRPGRLEDFLPQFESWKFHWLDVPATIRNAGAVFEFPMVDRDPVARWSFGRVTLLGDAAHPMYPIASNGATQAILDAQQLADSLATIHDAVAALTDYETRRIAPTAEIVRMNRQEGPDVILDLVQARAPQGFKRIDDVVPRAEIEGILARYKRAAGHEQVRSSQGDTE